MKVRHLLSLVIAIFALSFGTRELAAQTTDVIRGKVTGPDSLPIQGVTVTATSISGNVSRTARTDKNGNFSISFPNGDGDYIVSFASLGFAARRFQVKYRELIRPGERLTLVLRHMPEKHRLSFEYRQGNEARSSGQVTLAP